MGKFIVTTLALALYAITLDFTEARVSYKGYQLISVTPSTPRQVELIKQLQNEDRTNIMVIDDYVIPGRRVSIVINPEYIKTVQNKFQRYQLRFEVKHEDLEQVLINQLKNKKSQSNQATFDFGVYHNLQEIESFLVSTVTNNSDIAELKQIGFSYEGRPFYALHLSTDFDANRKAIWVDGGIHAREWIAPASMVYFINEIVSLYREGTDEVISDILDNMDIYIMAVFNVDGYEYSWSDDRLWRKTRSPNVGSPECVGTDPNRNWNTHWNEVGTSPFPCSDSYAGSGPFTEPEVKAVADYLSKNNIVMYLAVHNCGQFYLTPYGYTFDKSPDYDEHMDILEEAVGALEAVHGSSYRYESLANLVGPNAGSSADFTYEELGIKYSFGVELRDLGATCFELPEDEIIPTAEENFAALKVMMARVLEAQDNSNSANMLN